MERSRLASGLDPPFFRWQRERQAQPVEHGFRMWSTAAI
jgi:hypothetical protein